MLVFVYSAAQCQNLEDDSLTHLHDYGVITQKTSVREVFRILSLSKTVHLGVRSNNCFNL
jgi:hypothetical protein